MKKEISYFANAMRNPAKPFCAIVGGAKVSDKIQLLGSLFRICDSMVICGAMAYTFLRCKGVGTGKSRVEVRSTSKATGEMIDCKSGFAPTLSHISTEAWRFPLIPAQL
eukprot:gene21447-38467_t